MNVKFKSTQETAFTEGRNCQEICLGCGRAKQRLQKLQENDWLDLDIAIFIDQSA